MRDCVRIYIIVLTTLFNAILIYANNSEDYTATQYTQIPPSPEVASLMKYIDIPVSHFTGLPQINIPLYTITEGSLKIPISLSYRGGGIKQDEQPGIISKGWSLNAGITISRNVYGLPDDYYHGHIQGFFHLNEYNKVLRNKIIAFEGDYDPTVPNNNTAYTEAECYDYENGYADFANDIFKFYGMGMSGTFIFDENKNMTLSTASPIKFSSQNWKTCDYEIIDKNMTKYSFGIGGIEETVMDLNAFGYLEDDSLRYLSAWHVTKVQSIYKDSVQFVYSDLKYRNEYVCYSQYYLYYSGTASNRMKTNTMRARYFERNLEKIIGKTTTVCFHYDETTQSKLEYISIHKNDSVKSELWRYVLIRDNDGNLSYIRQIANKIEQELYAFDYMEKTCTEAKAIDHWGFCNGETSNTTYLPDVDHSEIPYVKANREPNESYTKQGILSQIKYPMGGTTILNWEQNDYSYIRGKAVDIETIITETTSTQYLKGKTFNERLVAYANSMQTTDKIRLNLATYFKSTISGFATVNFWKEYNKTSHDSSYPCVKIIHVKQNEEYVKATYYLDNSCETDSIEIYDITLAGNYRIELCNPRNFEDVDEKTINGYFGLGTESLQGDYGYIPVTVIRRDTSQTSVIKPWGGLRIASIISNPIDGNTIIKNYDYRKTDGSTVYSTGNVALEPNYISQSYHCLKDPETKGYNSHSVIGINSNGLYSSTDGELNIEYEEVWESYSGVVNGRIGYFYNTHSQYPDDYNSNTYCSDYISQNQKTFTSLAFKRGNLKEKHYSGWNNDDEFIYKKEYYEYDIVEHDNTPIFTGTLYTLCDFMDYSMPSTNGDIIAKSYTISEYTLIPYNKRVKSESVWEKDFYTGAESEQMVEYTYYGEESGYSSNPWNSFVKSKSYMNSRGQDVTIYYTYYKVGNVPLDLKELEIMVVDDIVVSARHNVYGTNHKLTKTYTGCVGMQFSSNFNLPDNILDDASYPVIDKEEYSYMYDSQGNIVQINYNGKVLASYLWGYMGKHPIVEAVGVSYAELFNIAKDSNYVTGLFLDDMNLFLNSFRADKRLQGKEVLTYTYYWLLGMATSTDSRGVTNTYFLDDFGRLSGVKDTNGYYISKYDYNYKGF